MAAPVRLLTRVLIWGPCGRVSGGPRSPGFLSGVARGSLRGLQPPVCVERLASGVASSRDFDLLVIGGGSGGLACAKEAADLGARVAVLDYVEPSPRGTRWGVGGTCVNVGCIPKKLLHHAALVGGTLRDAANYGWAAAPTDHTHSWEVMAAAVQGYVKSLNWGHRVQLEDRRVSYFNMEGSLIDPHTVKGVTSKGKERLITAENIVIAVGLRPRIPTDVPNAGELGISSDDLFWLKTSPGKTLIVGGGYVALESAGFLSELTRGGPGPDPVAPTVMLRSDVWLRGFDRGMAGLVARDLAERGVRMTENTVPLSLNARGGRVAVTYESKLDHRRQTEEFDTVLWAIGRETRTRGLNLAAVGVETDPVSGKILVSPDDRSSVPNIFAIGDVARGRPELTPVAIRAGRLLSRRLFSSGSDVIDLKQVPTVVFTPLELGSVGMTEEAAIHSLGEDNIEVYHAYYKPLEFAIPNRSAEQCYLKVICEREGDQKVLGFHFLGPSAGEVIQGFAVALRCGVTYSALSSTLGVHPTCAEELLVRSSVTRRSGRDPRVTSC